MSYQYFVLRKDDESLKALTKIFSPENKILCKYYGNSDNCNDISVDRKFNYWGKRSEDEEENSCTSTNFIKREEVIALINIGITQDTVRDNKDNSKIYEFSGLAVIDEEPTNADLFATAEDIIKKNCQPNENYTKIFISFNPDHPYQRNFLSLFQAVEITQENLPELLGQDSLHPERFKFIEDKLYECKTWDDQKIISHQNWKDSNECLGWSLKTAFLITMGADSNINQNEQIQQDL